jgi:hypothetical protein
MIQKFVTICRNHFRELPDLKHTCTLNPPKVL